VAEARRVSARQFGGRGHVFWRVIAVIVREAVDIVHRFKNVGDTTACMLDWTLPGGQDHYFKAIADLAAGGGFTGEKVMEINRRFDTRFPAAH
jgi:hypothetical protein